MSKAQQKVFERLTFPTSRVDYRERTLTCVRTGPHEVSVLHPLYAIPASNVTMTRRAVRLARIMRKLHNNLKKSIGLWHGAMTTGLAGVLHVQSTWP